MRISMNVEEKLYLLIKDYIFLREEVEEFKVEHEYLVAKNDEEAIGQATVLFNEDIQLGEIEYTLLDMSKTENYGRKVKVFK